MRNQDFDIDEDEAADLLVEIEHQLKLRQWGQVIRLEIERGFDSDMLPWLVEMLDVSETYVYRTKGPIDLTFLSKLRKIVEQEYSKASPPPCLPPLEYPSFKPQPVPAFFDQDDLFEVIRENDVLLHHPFESFDPIIKLIQQAAVDPDVLAIKQTLYRVSGQSPIIAALMEAAERGKQVLVLVELKARFDEESNIHWARRLEKAGCHVIYGLVGLKTHSKITLIVRREEDGIRRYVHPTGNYNDITDGYTRMSFDVCGAIRTRSKRFL